MPSEPLRSPDDFLDSKQLVAAILSRAQLG